LEIPHRKEKCIEIAQKKFLMWRIQKYQKLHR